MAPLEHEIFIPRPDLRSMLSEASGLLELGRTLWQMPSLMRAVRGDGSTVLVLPGFGADDRSTWPLRRYLVRIGYDVHGWGRGTNRADVPELIEAMGATSERLAEKRGGPIALVGWSLGGYIAREVARDRPETVRRVVTFGSPVIGGPKYTTVGRVIERQGWDLDEIERQVEEHKRIPLQVPITAIYSRRDGIVSWQACVDPEGSDAIEHVEVETTHLGLGFHPEVYQIVADRLARSDPR